MEEVTRLELRKCVIKGNADAVFFQEWLCALTQVKRAPAVGLICSCDKHNTNASNCVNLVTTVTPK